MQDAARAADSRDPSARRDQLSPTGGREQTKVNLQRATCGARRPIARALRWRARPSPPCTLRRALAPPNALELITLGDSLEGTEAYWATLRMLLSEKYLGLLRENLKTLKYGIL
ncbi:hypothetical protein EVAR_51659_1 [Eumeta japonica]|uniref:Uncharacterized protein n=1 Tax=Eumeta variegata TaxID=151549 RepID=A0A4C1YHY9_EUMVA|nr:hypothetical protein EVAR_51659_1 [Eumeta japonica]